ncbi:RNA polymerase sigma factor [Streptomyces sp. 6N223]|uniref:RNA polymerase sigma factor n=1 Tax=Streptomyces sp. 6N223 TaxID=3457412 RepID=UPI003FD4D5F7
MTGHRDHSGHIGRFTRRRPARPARRGAHRRADRAAPPEAQPDAALLTGARQGDAAAFAELYRRYAEGVWRHAREHGLDADTAEDLTEEAFAQTLQALRDGGGPRASLHDHLLATVRRLAAGRPAADGGEPSAAPPPRETTHLSAEAQAMVKADRDLLVAAFSTLPGRWQEVLWRTAVEREPLGRVGSALGLTTNATAVLAFRAREGLRQAFLQAHVSDDLAGREACRRYAGKLGAFIRGSAASRGLRRHLDACQRCRAAYLELMDVNATLRAVFPVAAAGGLASAVAASWPEAGGGAGGLGAAGPATAEAAAGVGGGGGVLAKLALAASVAFTAGSMSQQPGSDTGFDSGEQRNAAASAPDAEPAAQAEPADAGQEAGDGAPPPAEPGPRPQGGDASDAGSSCPYLPDDEEAAVSVSTGLGGDHAGTDHRDDLDDADGLDPLGGGGVGDLDCRTGVSAGFRIDPVEPIGSDGPIGDGPAGRAAFEEAAGAVDALGAAAREVTELVPLPEPEESPSDAEPRQDGSDALDTLDAEPLTDTTLTDTTLTDPITGALP